MERWLTAGEGTTVSMMTGMRKRRRWCRTNRAHKVKSKYVLISSLSLSQDILPDQLSGHKTMRGLDIKNVCVPVHSQTFLMV